MADKAELPLVLNVRQVAEVLCCNPKTVYAMISAGELEAVTLGRSLRVTRHALLEFLRIPDSEYARPALHVIDGGSDV